MKNFLLETVDVSTKMRLVTKEDFKIWSVQDLLGFQYFLYSEQLGAMQGPYYVEQWTDKKLFNNWYLGGIMYVICSPVENMMVA